MPVNKFGQMYAERVEHKTDGVSVSFIENNYLRKNASIDMSENRIMNVPFRPEDTNDAANAAFVIQGDLNVEQKAVLRDGTQPMMGHLDMSNHMIRNTLDPIEPQGVATKAYVDRFRFGTPRKPIITVWAEEYGSLDFNHYEWSFGNGASGSAHRKIGYCVPVSGRVVKASISAVTTNNRMVASPFAVFITKNGAQQNGYSITKPANEWSGCTSFEVPLELQPGDRINFITKSNRDNVECAIVCILIELDM